jgi:hypothetical protein
MRSVLPVLAMIAALVTAPVAADEPGEFEIYGLSLGQRAPDPSDLGGLQATFGPFIAKNIKGLMLVEQPVARYLLDLGNDHMLGVWFDGTSKDRPIYWLDLIEEDAGERGPPLVRADVEITPPGRGPLERMDITIDQALPAALRADIKRHIERHLALTSMTAPLPVNDLQSRLELVGDNFRGRIISFYRLETSKPRTELEYLDAPAARAALSKAQP